MNSYRITFRNRPDADYIVVEADSYIAGASTASYVFTTKDIVVANIPYEVVQSIVKVKP